MHTVETRPLIDYGMYDAAYLGMTPWRWSVQAAGCSLANPFNPASFTWAGRMVAASAEVFEGVVKRRGKPDWNVDATLDVIAQRPFCRLVRFSRERPHPVPRILLMAALSGHYATLMRGTVEALVAEHDVYVTDWIDARDVPLVLGAFDLETYISYTVEFLGLLGPDVHVVAVCQPAPPVLAAVALMAAHDDPAQPRSMTLMGGPVDTRFHPTTPTRLAAQHPLAWFERNVITTVPPYYPGAGRRVYPGFMQLAGFISLNPSRHYDAHVKMFNELVRGDGEAAAVRRKFYDEYLSVLDMSAEFFLQTLDHIFMRHSLPLGTLTWRGERVDLGAIRSTALLTVEGELDDIAAPGQTVAAHRLCSSLLPTQRDHLLQPGVGHYGIFNGRRWRESIVPHIRGSSGCTRTTRRPCTLHIQAAVHAERRAGNVGRPVFAQELHDPRDVFGRAQPALRDFLDDRFEHGGRNCTDHFGCDEARRHGVDGDPAARRFQRQALGETEQPGLGRRVIGLADVADLADDRADVHDPARSAFDHMLEDRLGHAKRAEEVHIEHLVPILMRHFADRLVDRDAGIVDQEIAAAVKAKNLVAHARAVAGIVDSALMDGNRRALRLEFRFQRLGSVRAATVPRGNGAAVECEHSRDARSDAARAAGDKCHLTVEHIFPRRSAKMDMRIFQRASELTLARRADQR